MKCILQAWQRHERELRRWMYARVDNREDADDLVQQVFEKALLQGKRFCSVDNARAWLFRVAKNTLIDWRRTHRESIDLVDSLPAEQPEYDAVDELSECLPRVLAELPPQDREAIVHCDLNGMPQARFARLKGLTLAGAKSRVQRARRRLRQTLERNCQVRRDETGKVCCFVPQEE